MFIYSFPPRTLTLTMFLQAADGARFQQVWFLMVLESLANVVIGFLGDIAFIYFIFQ